MQTKGAALQWCRKYTQDLAMFFNGTGCFEDTFSLQLKPDSKPYQAPPRHVAYALQEPFKEELRRLQEMDIITLLGIDETTKWCHSFVLVLKANGKVRLCLDPARLNQALIRPVHRGPTLNDILPKLNNVQYMSIINTSSGYHNLKLDKQIILLDYIFMSFWKVPIQVAAIQSSASRQFVSMENRWNF